MQGGNYDLRVIVYQSATGNRLIVTDQHGNQADNFLIKQINVVTYNTGSAAALTLTAHGAMLIVIEMSKVRVCLRPDAQAQAE